MQAERDAKTVRIQQLAGKDGFGAEALGAEEDVSVMQSYLQKISELEVEVKHLKKVQLVCTPLTSCLLEPPVPSASSACPSGSLSCYHSKSLCCFWPQAFRKIIAKLR